MTEKIIIHIYCSLDLNSRNASVIQWYIKSSFSERCAAEDCFGPSDRRPVGH